MAKIETHVANVKNHLNNGLSITSWDAIQMYGCTRLSAIIYVLKNNYDMEISSEMIEMNDSRFAKYTRIANQKQKNNIHNFLVNGGEIDRYNAKELFNCDHLKVVINELRNEGNVIYEEMKQKENGMNVKKYKYFKD
jgi:hypothetical protein